MAIDRVPALKRCRSLGLEPAVVGLAKSSFRQPHHANHKVSEYGAQLKENRKQNSFTAYWKTVPPVLRKSEENARHHR